MSRLDSTPQESEFGFSRPHLIGLAVLGLGAVSLFAMTAKFDWVPLERSIARPIAMITEKPVLPPSPKIANPSIELLAPVIADRGLMKPGFVSARAKHIPAVAVKPLFGTREPLPLSLHSFNTDKLKADLWKRTPKAGLDLRQASEAIAAVSRPPLEPETSPPEANREAVRVAGFEVGEYDSIPAHYDNGAAFVPVPLEPKRWPPQPIGKPHAAVLEMLDQASVQGLPFLTDDGCRLPEANATSLQGISRELHREMATPSLGRRRGFVRSRAGVSGILTSSLNSPRSDPTSQLLRSLEYNSQWHTADATPALVQILQTEPVAVRDRLIFMLASQPGSQTTKAIADRALYDLSSGIRQSAVQALKERPAEEYREKLLAAFPYPWEPVAWHAAEALVSLNDVNSIPALIELLDEPDPNGPLPNKAGKVVVRELVKINHLGNCLLCHAATRDQNDLVSAPIPIPGERSQEVYYSGSRSFLVRADVTYLRQDFSVMHDVSGDRPTQKRSANLELPEDREPLLIDRWPDKQRFDYLVRTRAATPEEIGAWEKKSFAERRKSSQRDAVLAALRSLTHQDLGEDSRAWRAALQNSPDFQSTQLKQRPSF